MRACFLVLVMAISGWGAFAADAPAGDAIAPALAHELALIDQANAKIAAKDWKDAASLLGEVAKDDAFGQLNENGQYQVYHSLGIAAYLSDDYGTAWDAVRQASLSEDAVGGDWLLRFFVALHRQDDDGALDSLTVLAGQYPALLPEIADQTIFYVARQAKKLPTGNERQAKLLKALFAAHWTPVDEPPSGADYLWVQLVRYDLEENQEAEAKVIASGIVNPAAITDMRIEKLFDPITTADPAHYDIAAAYEGALGTAKDWMASHPDKLRAVVDYAFLLVATDKPADAVQVLDAAMTRAQGAAKPPFSDYADEINWVYDTRARALMSLNRADEGLAEFAKGAALKEEGMVNVSQTINLADNYYLLDRPQDSLATLAPLDRDSGSPYGRMAYEEARGCAYAEMNDQAGLAKTMAYVDAHVADAPGVKLDVLVCAGDLDGAAAALIANLGDRNLMADTLHDLQIYRDPAGVPQPSSFKKVLKERWDALRARPDVKAAVDKVGRILNLPVVGL